MIQRPSILGISTLVKSRSVRLCVLLFAVSAYKISIAFAQPTEHHRHATLDARLGSGLIGDQRHDVLAMYLGVSSFYFGMGFYEEAQMRSSEDELEIEGLVIRGERLKRRLSLPFVFGAEVYRYVRPRLDLRIDAQFKGGLRLEMSHLNTNNGDRIPTTPETNYFIGGGLRAQAIYPFGKLLSKELALFHSFYAGVSVETDVYFQRPDLEASPDAEFGALFFFVLGTKKLVFRNAP